MSKMTDSIQDWILSFNSGRVWFNKLNSDGTKKMYSIGFKQYCDWGKFNPDQLIDIKIDGQRNVASTKEFQAETSLETYLTTAKLKPSVLLGIRTSVLSFYKANRRPLVEVIDIDTPESKKRCPKIEDILDLENAFQLQRDKAMLWFIASAPFRLDTLINLKWKDLQPTGDIDVPYVLNIEAARLKGHGKGRYKGLRQVAFLHSFAVQKLEVYKKELERKGYVYRENDPIFIPYRQKQVLKEMAGSAVEAQFNMASLVAWHNVEKKRFSPHDFRSFVQTALENAGVNANIICVILGHKLKGVDFHYSEHDVNDLQQKFKSALPYLLPQEVEVEKIRMQSEVDRTEISELRKDSKTQKEQIANMSDFVHKNLDPALDAFNLITGDPEGYAVWRKIQAKKLDEEREKREQELEK